MDGFDARQEVIVLVATNHPDVLDQKSSKRVPRMLTEIDVRGREIPVWRPWTGST
jgi:ATP-dependent 26S proteasome regulatory subunit